jgi:multisubunit Na+/H+ antiporter MnhB subunit
MIDAPTVGLALVVLGLAVWTVAARGSFAAVAGFIAYGLLLTLVWVRLRGIDVALTEAAIGGGLTGALLIGAAVRLRHTEEIARTQRPGPVVHLLAALLCGSVAAGLALCVLLLPDPAPTLAAPVLENIAVTEVGNPITAVLMAFRGMDTLLEAIVLVFAMIGVWSMGPDRFWGGRPGLRQHADPNGLLAYAARVLPPIGVVVGIYILWIGADNPGGKFQGATIMAAMWLLAMMAGLADPPPLGARWLRWLVAGGPLIFIGVGVVGVLTSGAFLAYPLGNAKPLILVIEFALMPTLTLILGLMLIGAAVADLPSRSRSEASASGRPGGLGDDPS